MMEYEDQFKELSRYAPPNAWSEEALVRKFLNGLLTKISKVVATQNLSTMSQITDAARGMEYPREPKRAKIEGSSIRYKDI